MRKSLVLAFERQPPAPTASAERKRAERIRRGKLLPGVDGRLPWVKRCKALIAEHMADLGGVENTSTAQRSLVQRAAVLSVELEMMEKRFALGEKSNLTRAQLDELVDLYARCANQLRRLLQAIGLTRRTPKRKMSGGLAELLREDERVRELRAQAMRTDATDAEIIEDSDA